MGSVNVHQSKSSDHDRLGFHPDCSTCRHDRLFGVLSPEPVFSHRVRVLLATGVLALSAGAATTSVAAEPDSHDEGVSVPEQDGSLPPSTPNGESPAPPADGQDESGQGEPGEETALPFEVDPVGGAPEDDPSGDMPDDGGDPAAPLENQPTAGPDGGLELTDPDAPGTINADDVPVPPTEPDVPATPVPPVAPPLGADGDVESPAQPPEPEGRQDGSREAGKDRRARDFRGKNRRTDGPARERIRNPGAAPAPAPVPVPLETTTLNASAPPVATASSVQTTAPPPGVARFHTVRAGESLWSIASDLLGQGASAAAIALEVERLWQLNGGRIGTGDRNLLGVGVKLRLR